MIREVGFNISGIPARSQAGQVLLYGLDSPYKLDSPGPPLGPKYLKTATVFSPFLMLPLSMASTKSLSWSKARHLPENLRPSFPVILATDPPGAKFPFKILLRPYSHQVDASGAK